MTSTDQAAIRSVLTAVEAAMRVGDADAIVARYAPDAVVPRHLLPAQAGRPVADRARAHLDAVPHGRPARPGPTRAHPGGLGGRGPRWANRTIVVGVTEIPLTEVSAWAPAACTLPTAERPLRQAEFDELFSTAVRSVDRDEPGRVRLELDPDPAVAGRAAELAARETGCCAFFTFAVRIGAGRTVLEVSTEDTYADALAERAAGLVR